MNPRAAGSEILGRRVYASLADLPVTPDIVDVFRRSEDLPSVADEAVAVGASASSGPSSGCGAQRRLDAAPRPDSTW